MSSSFFGLNVAVTGLLTSQQALDVINHNISNAATKGYSRQIVQLEANMPMSVANKGMVGTGSNVYDITRVRDELLDYKYWSEVPGNGEWDKKTAALNQLQTILTDDGTSGFSSVMNNFYSALSYMQTHPSESAHLSDVAETGSTFAKTLNSLVQKLNKEQCDADSEVSSEVGQINSIATQIASLNRQIYSFELDGHTANDLRDQRTVLIDNLSKIVNINVREDMDPSTNMKKMVISIGDMDLVNHIDTHGIVVQKNKANMYATGDFAGTLINGDLPYKTSITWANSTKAVDVQGGELKGLIDVRDGDGQNGNYKGTVYYIKQLDDFANNYASLYNAQNEQGYTLEDPPKKAGAFFVSKTNPAATHIKASEIAVSQAVLTNPNLMGISDYGTDRQNENTGNLKKLLDQKDSAHFFPAASGLPDGKAQDFLKSVLSVLAVDAEQADRMDKNQTNIINHINNMRLSVSSVDQNQEMADAVRFQQTFVSSAKMVNVMDELYDTIVNRLGMVGR